MLHEVAIFDESIHKNVGHLTLNITENMEKNLDIEEIKQGVREMLIQDPYRAFGLLRLYNKVENPPVRLFINFFTGEIKFRPQWAFKNE